MTEKEKNDFFYVCSLIEFIARCTQNKRGVIAQALGKEGRIPAIWNVLTRPDTCWIKEDRKQNIHLCGWKNIVQIHTAQMGIGSRI